MTKEKQPTTFTALSRQQVRPVPALWGQDELTAFIEAAEANSIATFAGMPLWTDALRAIDDALVVKSPEIFHEVDIPHQPSARLFMRAFGTFRAAVRLGSSGQLFETTVLVRSMLESAVYAWACAHSGVHRAAWLDRERNAEAKKTSRNAFAWSGLMKLLRGVNSGMASQCEQFYDALIDEGAHPNSKGVMLSTTTDTRHDGKFVLSTVFLHDADAAKLALLDIIRAMHFVILMLEHTVGPRLKELKIDQTIQQLRTDFVSILESEQASTSQPDYEKG